MIFWPDHPTLLISSCLLKHRSVSPYQHNIFCLSQHRALPKTVKKKKILRKANSCIKFAFLKTFPALEFSQSKCMHVVLDNALLSALTICANQKTPLNYTLMSRSNLTRKVFLIVCDREVPFNCHTAELFINLAPQEHQQSRKHDEV